MQDAILSRNYGVETWLFKQISFWDPCMFEIANIQKKENTSTTRIVSSFLPSAISNAIKI